MNSNDYNQNVNINIGEGSPSFEKVSLDMKILQDRSINCSNQY